MADLLSFWPFLFGWPAVALSVLAASFGLGRGHPGLLLVAATLVGPMSAHLALTPRFFVSGFVWGLFPVGVYLAAAVATRRNHMVLGAALVAANTAFFGWLAVGSSVKPVSGVTAVGQASSNSEPIRSGRPACTGDIDRCWPSTTPASGWPGRMSIPGRPNGYVWSGLKTSRMVPWIPVQKVGIDEGIVARELYASRLE